MMKFYFFLILGILGANLSFAQSQEHKVKEINFLVEKLMLNDRQAEKVTKIIQRKYDTFQVIQKYKSTNAKVYAAKLKALYEGTLISVLILLESDVQREAFRLYGVELRSYKAEKMKNYKEKGLSKEEASDKFYSEVIFS